MNQGNEARQQYLYARKIARHTSGKRRLHGQDPFLKVLNNIVDISKCSAVSLGQIDAPAEMIVGTTNEGRAFSFSPDFMPLLNEKSEFAQKWIGVCRYHLSDSGINEAPTAYEYMGKFYIREGNKRVSVLKSYGAPYIPLEVTRLIPEKSDCYANQLYEEFLSFYERARLYSLQFSKLGYYDKLLRCLNYEKDHEWTRRERIDIIGFYERLKRELSRKGIRENHADCLLAMLEMYTYSYLIEMTDRQMDRMIIENRSRLSYGKGFYSITCISDEEDPLLYSDGIRHYLKDSDFIVSAGDLSAKYLEYIVTMTDKPLFYIHGNHDAALLDNPPEGCICIDDDLVTYQGIRILGLGGSYRYNSDVLQYTEVQMKSRIRRLRWKIAKAKGVDIVVTHAPIAGYGDLRDYAHQGFDCFRRLLDDLRPRFWFYGHIHKSYDPLSKKLYSYKNTLIVNVSGSYKARY